MTCVCREHRLADGLLICADERDVAVTGPMLDDSYELNELEFVSRSVRAGDRVIDLGAHVGAYTVRLARLVGPEGLVIAVEPSGLHADLLRRSIVANAFEDRTEVVQAAASDVVGVACLRYPPAGSSPAHAWLESGPGCEGAEPVRTLRLDDLTGRHPVRFIKIDVEGAEGLALRGAGRTLRTDRPVVLAELHPHLLPLVSRDTPAALIAAMDAAGYECRLLGAGVPGARIDDTPTSRVTSVVFLPR